MFYYYGRKKRISALYNSPRYDRIVEPFAGSAAYSLHGDNWEKEVVICDTNSTVIGIWNYLKKATQKDISSLPDLKPGQKTTNFTYLSKEERDLIGFHINPGSSVPKITVGKFNRWSAGRKYILDNLHKIKHWEIIFGSYEGLPNKKSTWFIDPPYQVAGSYYSGGNPLDYVELGSWCLNRRGQIIVCEAHGATWLPFEHLIETKNCGKQRSKEVVLQRGGNGDLL